MLLLILLFSGVAFAQKKVADSLRRLIANESNDTSKIKLLINLAFNTDSDVSVERACFRQVYNLSLKKHFLFGLAYYHYYEGIQLNEKRMFNESIEKYKACIEELDSLHIIQPFDSPLAVIRTIYNQAGKQEEKFHYYTDKPVSYTHLTLPTKRIV